jgi:hypothetical protein
MPLAAAFCISQHTPFQHRGQHMSKDWVERRLAAILAAGASGIDKF